MFYWGLARGGPGAGRLLGVVSSCANSRRLRSVPRMRPYLRTAVLFLASASLIGFGSCERHKPAELAHGEHAVAEHTADAEQPAPSASATPAQFFPSPTP